MRTVERDKYDVVWTRTCSTCHRTQSLRDHNLGRGRKSTRRKIDSDNRMCQDCSSIRYQDIKRPVIVAYGAMCACPGCWEDRLPCLEIDHVDGDGYFERLIPGGVQDGRGGGGILIYQKLLRRLEAGEPPDPKYQVLCCNCNRAKENRYRCPLHYPDQSCPVSIEHLRTGQLPLFSS